MPYVSSLVDAMTLRIILVLILCGAAAALVYGRPPVRIKSDVTNATEQFAVAKLKQALTAGGYSVAEQGRQQATVSLREIAGPPESYSIRKNGNTIAITGADDRGLLYGTLRLAEEVKLGTPLAAVRDESRRPFVVVRAFKFNLPLPGAADYVSPTNLKNNQWFWSLDYWTKFLDALAEDRYNALEFWSAEPWSQMVTLVKYPKATSLSPVIMQRHIRFFRTLFHMAKVRGIDSYLVTWNIVLAPAFAHAHHLADRNVDSPLVRDYLRDCVRTMLVSYPELTGLGTTQGEDMDVIPDNQRGDWVRDVYFRGIRESGRKNVPFILRYWGGTPEDTEKAAAGYNLGAVYLDIKYNGEDVYSSPMYHVENSAWLTQKHNYGLLWHLRNDALFTFRWGNPEFVRELMRDMVQTHPAGFTYGSEEDIPGPENYDTPAARAHRPWPYEFQKQWFMYALWGRLGYNPDLSDGLWRRYFRYEYGSAGGDALYRSTLAAGRIAPLITSFHWNYMNGDWMPEGSIGSWNTSYEQPRVNYRRFEMYHNILDYVFNNTIDEHYENIPQYAAQVLAGGRSSRGIASPLDVANELEQYGRQALAAARIPSPGAAYFNRFQPAQSDDEAYGRLALYYAEKIRGAAHLGLYLLGGKPEEKASAASHLEKALAEWRQLVQITRRHYLPREIWQMGVFHWSMYTGAVAQDVSIARSASPAAVETQTWQVAAADAAPPAWKSLTFRERRPFGTAGFYQWRLYVNSLFDTPRVDRAVGASSGYLWERDLHPVRGRVWVLATPGSQRGRVSFSGNAVAPSAALSSQGYTIYCLGRGGTVKARLPDGIAPEVKAIAVNPVMLSLAAAEVVPPMSRAPGSALQLSLDDSSAMDVPSEVIPEVNRAGSALFRVSVPAPGFYRVHCELRGGAQAGFALDDYNFGFDDKIEAETGPRKAMPPNWINASAGRALPLGRGEHRVRIYLRHPGEEVKGVDLVAVQ